MISKILYRVLKQQVKRYTKGINLSSHQELSIKYEQERDTLFVFGAGASIAEGATS